MIPHKAKERKREKGEGGERVCVREGEGQCGSYQTKPNQTKKVRYVIPIVHTCTVLYMSCRCRGRGRGRGRGSVMKQIGGERENKVWGRQRRGKKSKDKKHHSFIQEGLRFFVEAWFKIEKPPGIEHKEEKQAGPDGCPYHLHPCRNEKHALLRKQSSS